MVSPIDKLRVKEVEEALRPKLSESATQDYLRERIFQGTKHLIGAKVTDAYKAQVLEAVMTTLQGIEGYDGDLNKIYVRTDDTDPTTINVEYPKPTPGALKVDI